MIQSLSLPVQRAVGIAALVCATSGCYKATFVEPAAVGRDRHEEWTSFFLFGLVGEEKIDVRKFCPGDVAMVRTGANAGTAVVSVLTIGIYTPHKVYVTCAAPREASR